MKPIADLILFNGRIHTQDLQCPIAQSVAISGNRILDVGADKEMSVFQSEHTQMIDLEDHLVLPAFIDTHFHFFEWALNYDNIDFSKTTSFKQMQDTIAAKANILGKDKWVLGQGFNESEWPENRIPDRHDLDQAAPDNPVCIWRCDLHLAVANTLGLKLAGINADTPDPDDSVIVRDSNGRPTGILKELAANLVRDVIPEIDDSTLLKNMKMAVCDAHKLGLTSVHDIRLMGGLDGARSLKAWQQLRQEDQLFIRCHVALPGEMTDQAIDLGLMTGFGDDILKIGHLKFFSDGGMGARTGWVIDPYLDAGTGMPLTPVTQIEKTVRKADQAGLSAMVHAIGDRAVREIIQMFARIEKENKSRCKIPHRIEHVQMIRPEDLDTLSRLKNVAVTCQPNNLSLDISMINTCMGDLAKYTYPIKSVLNTGAPVMLGSDAPVADPNPLAGIYSAVTRRRMDFTPKEGWHMKEALDIDEAVKGYTINPAIGSKTDHILGSITPGKFADLIVLDQDIYRIDPEFIAQTQIEITFFNGKIVYDKR